jgi:hypothetical protein
MGDRDLDEADSFVAWLKKNGQSAKVTTADKGCGGG